MRAPAGRASSAASGRCARCRRAGPSRPSRATARTMSSPDSSSQCVAKPADDGVVLGVAAGVGLAVEQPAEERVDGHVEGIGHLEHVEAVAPDRAHVAPGEHPLLDLVEALDRRRGVRVLERQRLRSSRRSSGSAARRCRGWRPPRAGSAGRRRPSLLRATSEMRSRYSCARDLLLHRGRRRRWRRRRRASCA